MTAFRPLLAPREKPDLSALTYPKLGSPKIDGFRCVIQNGEPLSRTLTPFPNRYVNARMAGLPHGLDGEIVVGEPVGSGVFNRTDKALSRAEGEPDFTYWVFDSFASDDGEMGPFVQRYQRAIDQVAALGHAWLRIVPHVAVHSAAEAEAFFEARLAERYEGAMLRDPNGLYKFNRATLREQSLLKLKKRDDSEGLIIGYYEQMHNDNVAEKNALGLTKRSTKKQNLRPAGTLGGVIVRWHNGEREVEFKLAVGGTVNYGKELWEIREDLPGQYVSFWFYGLGANGRPRHPTWKSLRPRFDLVA